MYDSIMGMELNKNGAYLSTSELSSAIEKGSSREKEYYVNAVQYRHMGMILAKGEDKAAQKISKQLMELSSLYVELYNVEKDMDLNSRWIREKSNDVKYVSELKKNNENNRKKSFDLQVKIKDLRQKIGLHAVGGLNLDDVFDKSVMNSNMVNLPEFRMRRQKVCFLKDISDADAVRMSDNFIRSLKGEELVDYVKQEKDRLAEIDKRVSSGMGMTSTQEPVNDEKSEKILIEETQKWAAEKYREEVGELKVNSSEFTAALARYRDENPELYQTEPSKGSGIEGLQEELVQQEKYLKMLKKILDSLHVSAIEATTVEDVKYGEFKTEYQDRIDPHYSSPQLAQEIKDKIWNTQRRISDIKVHLQILESEKEPIKKTENKGKIYGEGRVNSVFSRIFGRKKNKQVQEDMENVENQEEFYGRGGR